MVKKLEIKGWKDIPHGGVIQSGTSVHFPTGNWRSKVPVWQSKNCIHCMMCWAVCPDNSVKTTPDGKRGEYDYNFCKGCGICAVECPISAKVIKEIKAANPDAKIDAWDGESNPTFREKAAIVMVSLKEAKEKYNI